MKDLMTNARLGIHRHNNKFQCANHVRVMNIKDHPHKNCHLQLISKTGVDQYGSDIWDALNLSDEGVVSVSTSVFNPMIKRVLSHE